MLKSCLKTLRDVLNDMSEEFFLSKVIWEHHSIDFFLHLKKTLHFALRPNKSQKKIPLKIGYKIPWTYVLLILKFFDPHHKSYGFRRFFLNGVFVRRPEKSRFKSAEISAASSMDVGRYF